MTRTFQTVSNSIVSSAHMLKYAAHLLHGGLLMGAPTSPAESAALSARLRQMRGLLEPMAGRHAAAARALDLLDRDLLPRSAGGDASLVVGIVGPNNAGKSALFNSLVGRDLSPSIASGGATRRLVGAAHPILLEQLRAEPTLARFRLRTASDPTALADAALRPAADPAELLVVEDSHLPPGIMLIDTPDFDSILQDNRLGSESLLTVADLVIVVVTRHSYQNREVVTFLRHWLADGRPWLLVYNEALDDPVTRTHAAKLALDLGSQPLAVFAAPHSLAVQQQAQGLQPQRVDDGATPREPGQRLHDFLFDLHAIAEIKTHAFTAARARLRHDVEELASALLATAALARDTLYAATQHALQTGREIASAAMPGGPFIEAFRAVLDRRTNPLSRSWRNTLRNLRLRLESLPSVLRGRRAPADPAVNLAGFERAELATVWPRFWEDLVRDLGPEARHAARQAAPPSVAQRLDLDLADGRSRAARSQAEHAIAAQPADLESFRRACEVLVEKAIEDRGFDLDIQAAADVSTVLPLALAAAIIIKTGGLGTDLAAAGGGAVGTYLFEKYAHVLGGGIMTEARRRWTELRGQQLAEVLLAAALPEAIAALRDAADGDARIAHSLRQLCETVC